MKKWLINNFLPRWAKETVLAENKQLKKQNAKLKTENEVLRSYIDGVKTGAGIAVCIGGRKDDANS